jgi:hypothetical protein
MSGFGKKLDQLLFSIEQVVGDEAQRRGRRSIVKARDVGIGRLVER